MTEEELNVFGLIIIYGMEKNNPITTISSAASRHSHSWRVVFSYVLAILLSGLVVLLGYYVENGEFPIKLLIVYLPVAFVISSRRIFHDILEPKRISFFENQVKVSLFVFKWEREWIMNYDDVLITRIGYRLGKKESVLQSAIPSAIRITAPWICFQDGTKIFNLKFCHCSKMQECAES